MAQQERKTELIAELARSRSQITNQYRRLGHDLDFASRGRRAFARHPAIWIGGALLLGLFIARIPFRRAKAAPTQRKLEPVVEEAGKAGLLLGALKIAFNIARPALASWATRLIAERFDPARNADYPRR
jgi:hypothetical protein